VDPITDLIIIVQTMGLETMDLTTGLETMDLTTMDQHQHSLNITKLKYS
jgi:hypothetical protein